MDASRSLFMKNLIHSSWLPALKDLGLFLHVVVVSLQDTHILVCAAYHTHEDKAIHHSEPCPNPVQHERPAILCVKAMIDLKVIGLYIPGSDEANPTGDAGQNCKK